MGCKTMFQLLNKFAIIFMKFSVNKKESASVSNIGTFNIYSSIYNTKIYQFTIEICL